MQRQLASKDHSNINNDMKTLVLVLLGAIVVTSCSIFPPKYDNNEYQLLVELEVASRRIKENCSDPNTIRQYLESMAHSTEILNTYSFYLPNNTDLFEISKILVHDIQEMKGRYNDGKKPSEIYCKLKAETLTAKVRRALEGFGKTQ